MAKLKVEENLAAEVTTLLKDAGHDAMSIHDQNMVGCTDDHIASVCQMEERAIVTLDLDFSDIRSYPPEDHCGIVMRPEKHDQASVLEVLTKLIPKLDDEPLEGKLWIVNRRTIRIRS